MTEEKKKRKPPRRKTTYQCRTLRMSVDEKALLETKAAEAGKSVNQFILDAIQKSRVMPRETKSQDLREQNIWLNRINGNINMIAKHANRYQAEADAVLIQVRLLQIRRELQAYIEGRS
nr:hypothetical protein [uncultured bacterium]